MGIYSVSFRCLGLFVVVLMAGLVGGFGVGEVEAGCPSQVVSDTRECEHLWERQDLPDCIDVEALYEKTEHDVGLCNYEVRLENRCLDLYEFAFECDWGMFCPENYTLAPNESEKIKLRFDNYGKGTISNKTMAMFFSLIEEGEEGGDVFDVEKKAAGVFTGSSLGEVKYELPPGCEDVRDGCQMVSLGRPVGGLVGLGVMVLGLMGVAWRRRVVG